MARIVTEAPQRERHAIPAGSYTFTLSEIKDYEGENIYAEPDEDGNRPTKKQMIWIFKSDKKGPDGEPYEFAQFTGLYYGDERANLTSLLDFMLPDVSHEDKRRGVDVEALVGQKFRGRIAWAPNKKGDPRPKLSFLEPIAATGVDAIPT